MIAAKRCANWHSHVVLHPLIREHRESSGWLCAGQLAILRDRRVGRDKRKIQLDWPIGFVCGTGAFNSPPCSSLAELHLGLSAGAGVEYGITQNLSAKGEWIWVGAGAGNTLKENMLRLGLNWRFGM